MPATWSRVGHPPEVPVTGERKSVKILGAIELWFTRFHCQQDTVFNATTYLVFLEQVARQYRRHGANLIQDNASYHKDAEVWKWFNSNRCWLDVHQLPPYSPEFNPTERLWPPACLWCSVIPDTGPAGLCGLRPSRQLHP